MRKQDVHWHKQGRIPRAVSPGPAQAACSACLKSRSEAARGPCIHWQVANGPAPSGRPAGDAGCQWQRRAGQGRARKDPSGAGGPGPGAPRDPQSPAVRVASTSVTVGPGPARPGRGSSSAPGPGCQWASQQRDSESPSGRVTVAGDSQSRPGAATATVEVDPAGCLDHPATRNLHGVPMHNAHATGSAASSATGSHATGSHGASRER